MKIIALLLIVIFLLVWWIIMLYRNNKVVEEFAKKIDKITDTEKKLANIEELQISIDNKLLEILEKRLDESVNNIDHSLALKIADEIVRIEKNLSRMDKGVKGLKQLSASLRRIKDNYRSNGYEIVEMMGEVFNEGMKVTATFVPDENMKNGVQIITRIIKPQVNYNGVMIQSVQIEVSQGV